MDDIDTKMATPHKVATHIVGIIGRGWERRDLVVSLYGKGYASHIVIVKHKLRVI